MPTWPAADLSEIDFENIFYYVRPTENSAEKIWDDVPPYIKDTFDKLGIPEAERKFLAGVSAQYESEVVYHSIREDLEKQGVIFLDMDSGLREYPDLVKEYFGTVIPAADNKFSALNSAVWSGGSFIYVPKNTHVEIPLQAYFRINAENMGQFERTLIIADEGSRVHYIEGCTAPTYSSDSLHSAVVELIAKPGAHIRYTTIQNWSNNVYNLVTKRAVAYEDATVEWVDGNLGSKVTMKYPAVYLLGPRARAEILSVAFAGAGQSAGRGWQGHPRRARHDQHHHVEVDQQGRWQRRVSRAAQSGQGRREREGVRALRRAVARPAEPQRHLSVDRDRRGARGHRPRGDGEQGVRRAALLSPEPRAERDGGQDDDRQRLLRAVHQGAADGVRGRAEPTHQPADGRVDWLMPSVVAPRRYRLPAPIGRSAAGVPRTYRLVQSTSWVRRLAAVLKRMLP